MAISTPATVRKQIASGTVDPVYLLQGEDDVEKSALAHEFESLVEEGLRAFNVDRLYVGDATSGDRLAERVADLVTAARTLPMMSPRRVVLVMQADTLLVPKRESDAATRAHDELEAFLKKPEPQATVVLVAGAVDKRSRMYKLLVKHAVVVDCGVLEGAADVERWVKNRMAAAHVAIDPAGARLLAERCGADIKRLRNYVDRLLLYGLGQTTIELGDVREVVGPAALQDDWAMANAIEASDARTALRQVALMFDAGIDPKQMLGQLGWLVRTKFAPGKLRGAVDALFRTDRDLKSSVGEPRVLLERLVVELCGEQRGRRSAGSRL